MAPSPPPTTLLDLTFEGLTTFLDAWGVPVFRGRQIWRWVYQGAVAAYDEMTDLPLDLRRRLAATLPLWPVEPTTEHVASDATTKVLLRAADRRLIEAVLMRYAGRTTACLSSQLGCAVGCVFCQTGLTGFDRQLSAGEMLGQLLYLARIARAEGRSITNIVMMGMGEPLLNMAALETFLQRVTDPAAFGLGARRITVSTAGVAPRIVDLAHTPYQVNLAVSLHAADDALRSQLVPLNRRYPLAELMAACRTYLAITGRRISFEYTLIHEVNDAPAQAAALATLVHGLLCHVNLIPLNPVDASLREPTPERVEAFAAVVRARGIPTTVRYSRGRGVAAACGQLRARHEDASGQSDHQSGLPRALPMAQGTAST